jgi:hypothetical protein
MSNISKSECCVGINPHSSDWTYLARQLNQFVTPDNDKVIMDGDFTDYDGSLMPQILWAILDIINNWYNDQNYVIRYTLWHNIVYSIHISSFYIYMWSHSNPSGNPLTTIINCMYNSLAFRYVYLRCFNFSAASLRSFDKVVLIRSFGDDNIISASPVVAKILTPESIVAGFKALGMSYTSSDKSALPSFKTLSQIRFLKRNFLLVDGSYIAQLEFSVVEEMLYYKRKNISDCELGNAIDCWLHELSRYSIEIYNKYWSVIKKILDDHTLYVTITTDSYYAHRNNVQLKELGLTDFASLLNPVQAQCGLEINAMKEKRCAPYRAGRGDFSMIQCSYNKLNFISFVDSTIDHCGNLYLVVTKQTQNSNSSSEKTTSSSKQITPASANKTGETAQNVDTVANDTVKIVEDPDSRTVRNVAPSTTSQTVQITKFVDSAPVATLDIAGKTKNVCVRSDLIEKRQHSIPDILSRPLLVKSYNWTAGDAVNSAIISIQAPDIIGTQQVWTTKLANFRYFNCDLGFRIVINTHKFNVGRLYATFEPF